jgi:hypothetical protein
MNPRERQAREIQEVRRLLRECWDPIGVQDIPEAADEYESYVGGVHRLLAARPTAAEVAKHLWDIEVYRMGLLSKPGGLERLEPVAPRLLGIDVGRAAGVDLGGMTVNERLYSAGVLDEFDSAARKRDRDAMIALLMKTDLSREQAEQSIDALLSDPRKYGYPDPG